LYEAIKLLIRIKKDTKVIIERYKVFFEQLKDVDEVIVFGFSCSDVDFPYLHYINSITNTEKTRWIFSWYQGERRYDFEDLIRMIRTAERLNLERVGYTQLSNLM